MELKELLQDIVNKDYNSLLFGARTLLGDFLHDYKKQTNITDDLLAIMIGTVLSDAVAIDNAISPLEEKFLSDLLGLDRKKIIMFVSLSAKSNHKIFVDFFDTLDKSNKSTIVLLLAYVLSCDEKINVKENNFFMSLLKM